MNPGMYHALIEDRMPFEMVNTRLLDTEHLKGFKLLILPNTACLSDEQCNELRKFVQGGRSIVATFETSLYNEKGEKRPDFGLKEMFGISFEGVEGPMQNSYLLLKKDASSGQFHPVLKGLEDAFRIINTIHQVKVKPQISFPNIVTLIPTYPDLPMEEVYPRTPETNTRELYLLEIGKGRIAYFPGDIDRTFWQIMNADHAKLLRNTIRWALNEDQVVEVTGPGVIDVSVWRQENSMAVHLVNLTNPMMMKGPFREFIPVDEEVKIRIPKDAKVKEVHLLMSGIKPEVSIDKNVLSLKVRQIQDYEIIGIDLV